MNRPTHPVIDEADAEATPEATPVPPAMPEPEPAAAEWPRPERAPRGRDELTGRLAEIEEGQRSTEHDLGDLDATLAHLKEALYVAEQRATDAEERIATLAPEVAELRERGEIARHHERALSERIERIANAASGRGPLVGVALLLATAIGAGIWFGRDALSRVEHRVATLAQTPIVLPMASDRATLARIEGASGRLGARLDGLERQLAGASAAGEIATLRAELGALRSLTEQTRAVLTHEIVLLEERIDGALAPATAASTAHAAPPYYTVQLVAGHDRASLEGYRRRNADALAGLELIERDGVRRGQPWHMLLAGRYLDPQRATRALAELPPALRDGGAFVRPVRP